MHIIKSTNGTEGKGGGDAYVYSPPDDGIAVPSSAYEIAPRSAMMPARTHACKKWAKVWWCGGASRVQV